MQKKLLSVFIGAAIAASSGAALAEDAHNYIGANLGYISWDDDRFSTNNREDGLTLGFNVGRQYGSDLALELSANTGVQGPDGEVISFSLLNFLGDPKEGALYWLVGASYLSTDTRSTVAEETIAAHIGLGLSKYVSSNLELRGDFRYYEAITASRSIASGNEDDIGEYTLGLSLNYHFSKPEAAPARLLQRLHHAQRLRLRQNLFMKQKVILFS